MLKQGDLVTITASEFGDVKVGDIGIIRPVGGKICITGTHGERGYAIEVNTGVINWFACKEVSHLKVYEIKQPMSRPDKTHIVMGVDNLRTRGYEITLGEYASHLESIYGPGTLLDLHNQLYWKPKK